MVAGVTMRNKNFPGKPGASATSPTKPLVAIIVAHLTTLLLAALADVGTGGCRSKGRAREALQ